MRELVVGFDVYGTLVDPLAMAAALEEIAGEAAERVARAWRGKQVEYAFRRGLMGPDAYVDFTECTRQALRFACAVDGISLAPAMETRLLEAYLRLPAFPEATGALAELRDAGARVIAFSNGTEAAVRAVLDHSGLLGWFDAVVSVDPLRTYKPDPAVYAELVRRGGAPRDRTWLVSANGWDALGARQAGLRAVWTARDPAAMLDPWNIEPDLIASDLGDAVRGIITTGV